MSKKTKQKPVVEEAKPIEQPQVVEPEVVKPKEQEFPKELLVKSKQLSQFNLHKDIIRAILVNDSYTLSDAKEAIQKYIDSFKR